MMEPAKDRMRNNVSEPPDVEQRGDIFRPGWGAPASGGHLEMFLSERNFRPMARREFLDQSRVPRCVTAGRTLERSSHRRSSWWCLLPSSCWSPRWCLLPSASGLTEEYFPRTAIELIEFHVRC